MSDQINVRAASALLRISLGVMFLTHSIVLKVLRFGFAGTAHFFQSLGLPAAVAYGTIIAEAIGGALLVLGIGTRAVALTLIPILIGATWVHLGNGWVFSNAGGGWEYPAFLIVVSVAVALLERGGTRPRLLTQPAN
ncbi:MAG TPA: DoxX family protein [Steroidobacteraceae bacterium]|nr:DoxX family protein [Steroidobacteraceae bacterium]